MQKDYNNFQRRNSSSNAQVGINFEEQALAWLKDQGITATRDYSIPLGLLQKKHRKFDFGSKSPPVLVECKSHRWTESDNIPSAKMTVWNEAMYYFHLAPPHFRKIFFVLKDWSKSKGETLGSYYTRTYSHLIPPGVEIWEFDELAGAASRIN